MPSAPFVHGSGPVSAGGGASSVALEVSELDTDELELDTVEVLVTVVGNGVDTPDPIFLKATLPGTLPSLSRYVVSGFR